jgi:hypothetical protein
MQEGHPVAFYSRKLSGPEQNYSVSDIEMLAVIASLREWRCYLEGRPFTLLRIIHPILTSLNPIISAPLSGEHDGWIYPVRSIMSGSTVLGVSI